MIGFLHMHLVGPQLFPNNNFHLFWNLRMYQKYVFSSISYFSLAFWIIRGYIDIIFAHLWIIHRNCFNSPDFLPEHKISQRTRYFFHNLYIPYSVYLQSLESVRTQTSNAALRWKHLILIKYILHYVKNIMFVCFYFVLKVLSD